MLYAWEAGLQDVHHQSQAADVQALKFQARGNCATVAWQLSPKMLQALGFKVHSVRCWNWDWCCYITGVTSHGQGTELWITAVGVSKPQELHVPVTDQLATGLKQPNSTANALSSTGADLGPITLHIICTNINSKAATKKLPVFCAVWKFRPGTRRVLPDATERPMYTQPNWAILTIIFHCAAEIDETRADIKLRAIVRIAGPVCVVESAVE